MFKLSWPQPLFSMIVTSSNATFIFHEFYDWCRYCDRYCLLVQNIHVCPRISMVFNLWFYLYCYVDLLVFFVIFFCRCVVWFFFYVGVSIDTCYLFFLSVGGVKSGDSVLIHAGGSGVGTAATQLSILANAKPIVTAGSTEKINMAKSLGAVAGFNYKEGDFSVGVKQHTKGTIRLKISTIVKPQG